MSIKTITGVPPIDFLSVGQPLSAWSISGNSQQSGTPAPDAPIYPEFVGERTANLFDELYPNISTTVQRITINVPNGDYTMSTSDFPVVTGASVFLLLTGEAAVTQTNGVFGGHPVTQTVTNGNLIIGYRTNGDRNPADYHFMLNTGSTAKPYEPYGYKIPITCTEQTTPVYFGQVQTTRRIKKLVFDGTEDWRISGSTFYLTSISPDYARVQATSTYICTHFQPYQQTSSAGNVPNNMIAFGYSSSNQRLYCAYTGVDTVDGFKQWLAAQYAAGTPVTIWYVLATPITGIVDEPLCKIGDYGDTVSNTNTGTPSIPTSEGSNVLTIGTTVQPSEVSITYMAPNTIAENLQRLQIARTNIATAITTKGGTLVENAGFEDFPDAINNIPSESGGMPMGGITILLYDGSTFGDAGPTTIIEEGSI